MQRLHGDPAWKMRDIFLDGLRILDVLEITGSTAATANWVNCDQSSVSRSYRRVSEQLGLHFSKTTGRYQAGNNLRLLQCLRQAAQMLRLEQGPQWLQWVSHFDLALDHRPLGNGGPLPRSWSDPARSLELLRQRVLDLAVLADPTEAAATDPIAISCLPLGPSSSAHVVVLQELQDKPALRQLIAHLTAITA